MNAPRLVPEKSNQQSKNHSTAIQPKTAGVQNACQAIVDSHRNFERMLERFQLVKTATRTRVFKGHSEDRFRGDIKVRTHPVRPCAGIGFNE